MKHVLFVFAAIGLVASTTSVSAQQTFPINGIQDHDKAVYAFTHATIHPDPYTTLADATLLVQEGKVIGVGPGIAIPKGAIVTDLKDKHIYASFIDAFSSYGIKQPEKERGHSRGPKYDPQKPGAYAWNDALNPEANAAEVFMPDDKKAEALRKEGFGATVTLIRDGIARGRSALVLVGNGSANENLVQTDVAANYSFSKGRSSQDYPSSLMGSIALLKQTYLDGQWYASLTDRSKEMNLGLEAWNANQPLPQLFETNDLLNIFRADKLGDSFGKQYVFVGSGNEYRRLDAVKATGGKFIIPMKLPENLDVEDPFDAQLASYEDLLHWELAATNPKVLKKSGVAFAFTLNGLEKEGDMWPAIAKMLEAGLDSADAIAAFTTAPAQIMGLKNIGSLQVGNVANFIVTSNVLFREKTAVLANYVKGIKYEIGKPEGEKLEGNYELTFGTKKLKVELGGTTDKPEGKLVVDDSTKLDLGFSAKNELVTISFAESKDAEGKYRLTGRRVGKNFLGKGQNPDGVWADWSLNFSSEAKKEDKKEKGEKDKKDEAKKDSILGNVCFPFMAYGYTEAPKQETVLIKNTTVWTNEKDGILTETDVLLEGGKIKAIGKGLSAQSGATVVDGKGKHLTSGIIDEHSHIAISRGVNEGTQAVTAEVSIADVVNSEDINIYRQLAGGVTAAQLLHGSANPIGGQSGIIKLRWGKLPEEMKIAGAAGHIKFALGENVKQANWGEDYTTRYPQTRMGVEQVFYDAFLRAKQYKLDLAAYAALGKKEKAAANAPRRDLELETILEILEGKRFVTCHSYVQSEINMLMHVADSMGWKMNTFTHILEGYKVADKMVKHGVNGSTFSDWWAYKFEVHDAIPYNAALMHEQGVNVGINSDDAEMGRRLNQEAAKSVKYGGMSEEDAWKMVTLNPAKMLKLDDRTGSIKVGKDADVVLWSANPLSIYAKAEKTYVDGILYYSTETDRAAQQALDKERNRIIQKLIAAKKDGAPSKKPSKKEHHLYHCDTLEP